MEVEKSKKAKQYIWIKLLIGIICLFVSGCGADQNAHTEVVQTQEDTMSLSELETETEQTKKDMTLHPIDSVPQPEGCKDQWFGYCDGRLVCVNLDTKECQIVADLPPDQEVSKMALTYYKKYAYAAFNFKSETMIWMIHKDTLEIEEISFDYPYDISDIVLINDKIYLTGYGGYGVILLDSMNRPKVESVRIMPREAWGIRWLYNPWYMGDVYGYRLGCMESGAYPIVTDADNRNQQMLPGEFPYFRFSKVILGNLYILFINENTFYNEGYLLSLEDGSVKQIAVNGTAYQLEGKELYYWIDTELGRQICCMDVETGSARKLSIEECKTQVLPDCVMFYTISNSFGTYLYRFDKQREYESDSTEELVACLSEDSIQEIGYYKRQTIQKLCAYCDQPFWDITISLIEFEPKTQADQKIAKSVRDYQEEQIKYLLKEDSEYQQGHFFDENGCYQGNNEQSFDASLSYIDEGYLCLEFVQYSYFYTAPHPNSETIYKIYDRKTGEQLSLRDIVDYTQEEWIEIVRSGFVEDESYVQEDGTLVGSIEEHLGLDMNFALMPEGLLLYFNRYEVAGYAWGQPAIILPYDTIRLKIALQH